MRSVCEEDAEWETEADDWLRPLLKVPAQKDEEEETYIEWD